jgi:hypothetical protein
LIWYGLNGKLQSGGMVEQREGYYDYMVRRMREEDEKCRGSACRAKLPMSPWEATRKINELEKRIKELEDANIHVSK